MGRYKWFSLGFQNKRNYLSNIYKTNLQAFIFENQLHPPYFFKK